MPTPSFARHPSWWILGGLSVEEWTPSEVRWFRIERRKLQATLPGIAGRRLEGIVVDWEAPDDVRLLKAIRPGDRLVTVARQAPRRWVVEPAAIVHAKDTYWWPSMRRTTMLTVERPSGVRSTPLADVVRTLAKSRVTLRGGGRASYPLTSGRTIAALAAALRSPLA